jgi:hypothetical protein
MKLGAIFSSVARRRLPRASASFSCALVCAALLFSASCKRPSEVPTESTPSAGDAPAQPAKPRAALPPAPPRPVRAPVEEPAPLPDETVAKLLVETGANRLAYRGWPLRIRYLDPDDKPAPDGTLTLLDSRGTECARLTALKPGLWWLTAAETARLAAGKFTLRLGPTQAGVAVADAPAALSPELDSERRFAIVFHASESGDTAAARREAEAWAAFQEAQLRRLNLGHILVQQEQHRCHRPF